MSSALAGSGFGSATPEKGVDEKIHMLDGDKESIHLEEDIDATNHDIPFVKEGEAPPDAVMKESSIAGGGEFIPTSLPGTGIG